MAEAKEGVPPTRQLTALGTAYVCFARDNPALYRVMYDVARNKEALPAAMPDGEDTAYCKVRQTMLDLGREPVSPLELELATIAAWCGAHGLAEMAGFRQFDQLKEQLGGEKAFLQAVLSHMGLFPHHHSD
jgi:hypothetical protein